MTADHAPAVALELDEDHADALLHELHQTRSAPGSRQHTLVLQMRADLELRLARHARAKKTSVSQ